MNLSDLRHTQRDDGESGFLLEASDPAELTVWPPLPRAPKGFRLAGQDGEGFARYQKTGKTRAPSVSCSCSPVPAAGGEKRWKLVFEYEGRVNNIKQQRPPRSRGGR